MEKSYRNQDYQKIVNNLFCTDEGKDVLSRDDDTLGKRDRQFLLLLANDDTVSRRVCAGLAHKISLKKLLEQGLLDCFTEKEVLLKSIGEAPKSVQTIREKENVLKPIDKVSESQKKVMEDNTQVTPSPDVMIAAGIFT